MTQYIDKDDLIGISQNVFEYILFSQMYIPTGLYKPDGSDTIIYKREIYPFETEVNEFLISYG